MKTIGLGHGIKNNGDAEKIKALTEELEKIKQEKHELAKELRKIKQEKK